MTQRSARITCPRCGANNFETVSACWKCGTALAGAIAAPQAQPGFTPQGYVAEKAPAGVIAQISGDPNVATRAAILLALTIPWIGLPAGWLFMMVEDYRKQRVGRICVMWSLVALVFHLLFTVMITKWITSGLITTVMPYINAKTHGSDTGADGGFPGQ